MTMNDAAIVAIFVKTPGRSPIKTRLAQDLGSDLAESLYLESLAGVVEAVDASGLDRCWAVAEPPACGQPPWNDAPCLAQADGDLGARMAGVYRSLRGRHAAVLLIGGDLPQLDPQLMKQAAAWLGTPDRHVIGPASDGGFWLYGSSAEDPTRLWSGLPYSRRETAARFRSAIDAPPLKWLELPQRTDLDERRDLPRVVEELAALHAPTPAQRRIRELLARVREAERE